MSLLYLDDFLSEPKTLAFSSLCGISKQVPSITTMLSLFMKAPIVSRLGIGRTNWWNNCLSTPAPNLCRGWVMGDVQRIRQLLPIFTYASLRPSIRFCSTSRIESFDHRLIAMTRHTTSCAGSWRWRLSSTWRGDNKSQNIDRIKDIALRPLWKNGSLLRLILINSLIISWQNSMPIPSASLHPTLTV